MINLISIRFLEIAGPTSAYLHINKDLKIGDDYRQEFTVRIRENAESSVK